MEDALKLIAALASTFALYKVIVDVVLARSSTRRDEYEFTKQYFGDLNNNEIHHYILEKGFYALTGKVYSVPEIKCLLRFENPSMAINRRKASNAFIDFQLDYLSYTWKGRYLKPWVQKFGVSGFMVCYFIFAFVGLLPFYSEGSIILSSFSSIVFLVSFLTLAVACLIYHEDFKVAKKFMGQVEKDKAGSNNFTAQN